MKDGDQQKATDNPLPIKTRSERRAAKIAQTKIAESAKILASTKIIATAGLEKDPAKTRARRTKSVSSAKGTPTPKPPILPKIPLLVFDGAASPVPNVLSLLASTSYDRKPSASTVTASEKTTVEREKPNPSLKRKSSSSIVRNTGGLLMECQSDDLSPVQWATYRRAENEYLEVLRKLARWKSRPEVEIVYLNENGSVPSPPKFMSVSEAAKLPLPKASQLSSHLEVVLESKPLQAASVKKSPSVVQIASAIPNASSGAQTKILVTMQSSGLRITEARSQGSATPTSQAHVMLVGSLVNLYGKPRRTASKSFAASLFSNGRDIDEIGSYLNINRIAAEVYLIDSLFLGDAVDHMRLCRVLGVTKPIFEHVSRVVQMQPSISLPKLQSQTLYSFNQIRMVVALLHRGLKWS